jgi:chitosanase
LCFPNDGLTGDNGHDEDDVLFIGFTGKDAMPSAQTKWNAGNAQAFEDSIKDVGDKLVAGLKA